MLCSCHIGRCPLHFVALCTGLTSFGRRLGLGGRDG